MATLEPYDPPGRCGVRIEDVVVATEDGGRRLNNTSHQMYIVS